MKMKDKIIVFEGLPCSGKTTIINSVIKNLNPMKVVKFNFIDIITQKIDTMEENQKKIQEQIGLGRVVFIENYIASFVALSKIKGFNVDSTYLKNLSQPYISLYMDIDPIMSFGRVYQKGIKDIRLDFFRQYYKHLFQYFDIDSAEKYGEDDTFNNVIIDCHTTPDRISNIVTQIVSKKLGIYNKLSTWESI